MLRNFYRISKERSIMLYTIPDKKSASFLIHFWSAIFVETDWFLKHPKTGRKTQKIDQFSLCLDFSDFYLKLSNTEYLYFQHVQTHLSLVRSNRSEIVYTIGVAKNFPRFTRKHIYLSLSLITFLSKKRIQRSCLPVNWAKFLRALFLSPPDNCFWLVINNRKSSLIEKVCIWKVLSFFIKIFLQKIARGQTLALVNRVQTVEVASTSTTKTLYVNAYPDTPEKLVSGVSFFAISGITFYYCSYLNCNLLLS